MSSQSNETFHKYPDDFLDKETLKNAGILDIKTPKINSSIKISSLEFDSRKVKEDTLYFALPGLHVDGHDFIQDAIKKGARIIVHQNDLSSIDEGVIYLKVKNSRFAMSPISASFYGHPSREMIIIGVTGTEGKSTTVYLIYQLLKLLGKKTGFISTVQRDEGKGELWNQEHQTTPEAPIIQQLLREMKNNEVEIAVIESSSHGLSKKTNRLGDVDFDIGVMTNVNHDHLEFHGSWEQYQSDKAELFRSLKNFGVVNRDDNSSSFFTSATKQLTYSFSTRSLEADLTIKLIHSGKLGNWYDVLCPSGKTITIRDKLPGSFNAGNVLASILVTSNLYNIEIEKIVKLIPYLKPVRGRMSSISKGQDFEVLVDYAHTPSSFETVLYPLRERLEERGGKLICVFGSAGERDTEKRPIQGAIAAQYSDIIILCDEDPRGEEPMSILEDIAKGCEASQGFEKTQVAEANLGITPNAEKDSKTPSRFKRGKNLFLIPDRPSAIRKAFSLAEKNDLVLLLGKGHENSIIQAKETLSYDEIQEAEKALEELGYSLKTTE